MLISNLPATRIPQKIPHAEITRMGNRFKILKTRSPGQQNTKDRMGSQPKKESEA